VSESEKVLLVIPDGAMARFVSFLLREWPKIEVDRVHDAETALRKLAQIHYPLIICDQTASSSSLNVFKVLESVREMQAGSKESGAIVLADSPGEDYVRQANQLGVAHVLGKPVHAFAMREAIRDIRRDPNDGTEHERRKAPRLRIPVTVQFQDSPTTDYETFDINPFGAFFVSDELREAGTEATAVLTLPHLDDVLMVDCTVMHIRAEPVGDQPRGFGVRFDPHDSAQAQKLRDAFTSPTT
jgi:CheY-like chemotaxis protein